MQNKKEFIAEIQQIFDFLILGFAFWLAYYTKIALVPGAIRGLTEDQNYLLVFFISGVSCHFCLRFNGTYPPFNYKHFNELLFKTIKAIILGTLISIIFLYLTHIANVSRLLMGLFTLFSIVLLSIKKGSVFFILNKKHIATYAIKNVLIVGTRDRSLDVIDAIMTDPIQAYHIIGCLETSDKEERIGKEIYKSVLIIGTLSSFNTILLENSVDEIIFALPLKNIKEIHNYIYYAEEMGIKIRVLPDFQIQKIRFYPKRATLQIDQFLGLPTLAFSSISPKELDLYIKNVLDYVFAAFGLLLLSPVFLIIIIFIKATSPGPIFFFQERCGLNGRHFLVRKFRTMHEHAEKERETLEKDNEMDGPVFKIKNDPRISTTGRFLRKTSLDELPQLINVLRGEMSLVGPRPPIPSEVEQYQLWQRRRLSMKPGITCIWQVSGRNDVSFEKWMHMDLEYIDNWSLLLDFKILFLTIKEVTLGGGR